MSHKTQFRQLTNAFFHVYNRGVRKSKIFDSPRNYDYFLTTVPAASEEYRV